MNKYANVVFHHRQSGDPVAFVDPQQVANAFYDLHRRVSKLEAETFGDLIAMHGPKLTLQLLQSEPKDRSSEVSERERHAAQRQAQAVRGATAPIATSYIPTSPGAPETPPETREPGWYPVWKHCVDAPSLWRWSLSGCWLSWDGTNTRNAFPADIYVIGSRIPEPSE